MAKLGLALCVAVLAGCASAGFFTVKLRPPAGTVSPWAEDVRFVDARADKQTRMTMESFEGPPMVSLTLVPPLDEVLRWRLAEQVTARIPPATVSLELLQLHNRVGYGKADAVTCRIVSRIKLEGEPELVVQTDSAHRENLSPLVSTAAQKALDQCLSDHAAQIVPMLTKAPVTR